MSEKAMRRNEEREAEMHCASQYKYYHITDAHRAGHTHTLTRARIQASFSRNDTLSTNNFFGILCD